MHFICFTFFIEKKTYLCTSIFELLFTVFLQKNIMDIAIKEKIENLIQEISNISDLPTKMEAYNYMIRQADFCLWSLEEEQRQYENAGNY